MNLGSSIDIAVMSKLCTIMTFLEHTEYNLKFKMCAMFIALATTTCAVVAVDKIVMEPD